METRLTEKDWNLRQPLHLLEKLVEWKPLPGLIALIVLLSCSSLAGEIS